MFEMNNNADWILAKAKQEDNATVSAGGLYAHLAKCDVDQGEQQGAASDVEDRLITLARLAGKTDEELREYVSRRLMNREVDLAYQELPEDEFARANSANDEAFSQRFAACVMEMTKMHLTRLLEGADGEEEVVFRLLSLAETTRCSSVALVLQEALVEQGRLRVAAAKRLLSAEPSPCGVTLLHQSLSSLSILESDLDVQDRCARGRFWEPLLDGRFEDEFGFPASLRMVALRSLVRIGWKASIEESLTCVLNVIVRDLSLGRSSRSVVRELANLICFFISESRRQECEKTFGSSPTLLDDPTPLAVGFYAFAANEELLAVFEKSLRLVCQSSVVFDGNDVFREAWKNEYVPEILEEIKWVPVGNVLKRVRMKQAAEKAFAGGMKNFRDVNRFSSTMRQVSRTSTANLVHA